MKKYVLPFAVLGAMVMFAGLSCSENGTGNDDDDAPVTVTRVHGDVFVTSYDDVLYVVERKGSDRVLKVDPGVSSGKYAFCSTSDYTDSYVAMMADGDTSATKQLEMEVLGELSVGTEANPQDIAFVSATKAYVSRAGGNHVWIIDPTTMTKTGQVDLSAYVAYAGTDSAQSTPQMGEMELVGSKLYVACQRTRDDFSEGDVSLLVIIDTGTDAVTGTIELDHFNPYGLSVFGNRLYAACVGQWSDASWMPVYDGGLVVVDTDADTSMGIMIREDSLQVNISDVLVFNAQKGLIKAVGTWPSTAATMFDPATGGMGANLAEADAVAEMAVAFGGSLYILNQGASNAGIYIYSTSTGAKLRGPIDTGLAPQTVTFIDYDN